MPRARRRVFWRRRGRAPRAYGDFRDFESVGGGIEALIVPGDKYATTDCIIAEKLANDRLRELQEAKRNKVLLGTARSVRLQEFAAHHLAEKTRSGRFTDQWLQAVELHLRTATEFFGRERELSSIRVADVQRFVAHLRTIPNGRGKTLTDGAVRKYLNSLSNLYRRAIAEESATFNPVSALMEKPTARMEEAKWLEVDQAARLLESAQTCETRADMRAIPFMYSLLATFLLTGGRKAEVLGLQVGDIDFDRKTVTFRPNRWRRLKTATAHRVIPLWPQLEEILREHVSGEHVVGSLLFPSSRLDHEGMVVDLRKALDRIAARAGWQPGEIRTKIFRHSYCAARLQTLDNGAPVAPYTVSRELGHSSTTMVEKVYSHLGRVRHRAEAVEYRLAAVK